MGGYPARRGEACAASRRRAGTQDKDTRPLAIIRGNSLGGGASLDWADTFKGYRLNVPLVILKDSMPGFFSFARAVSEALGRLVDAAGKSGSFWMIGLDPVRRVMPDTLKEDYLRYKRLVLDKA